jgi:outer membrane protein
MSITFQRIISPAILGLLIWQSVFSVAMAVDSQPGQNSNSVDAQGSQLKPAIAPEPQNANSDKTVNADPQTLVSGKKLHKIIPPSAPTGAGDTEIQPQLGGNATTSSPVGPLGAQSASAKEEMVIEPPELKALISVNDYMNPLTLDAEAPLRLNLHNTLLTALDRNLDLAISRSNEKVQQWTYYGSLGKFLPDLTGGFNEYFAKGAVGIPTNFATLAAARLATTGTTGSMGAVQSSTGNTVVHIDSPFFLINGGLKYYGYRGGRILFGMLQSKHNYRAAKEGARASYSDVLLTATRDYYNLMLAQELLQIRIQAVRTSKEQLRNNTNLEHSGLATRLDVLQSQTQLSRDSQNLVNQQVARRNASITLANDLNIGLGTDIFPGDGLIRKVRLLDSRMTVPDLLRLGIDNRPELKQYEQLRLAAKRAIIVAAAPLQPTMAVSGNILGIGPPSRIGALGVLGINVNWQLGGLGTAATTATQTSRWEAREAYLQANKELVTVLNQVRSALLQSLDTEKNIEQATTEVVSAEEELRLAQLRFKSGLGTNLDIITAQRDLTQAYIDKAQAIINFDIAQAQLLHDIGLTSVDNLSSGRLLMK